MKLIDLMGTKYSEMTKIEKRIFNYIMENTLEFTLQPIGDVASELETSKTSLMRFAKNLGFDSYSEFKKKLQEEEIINSSPAERFQKLIDSKYLDGADKIHMKETENIKNTFLNLDERAFNELVEKITSTNMVYTVGCDVCYFLSEILAYRMKEIGFSNFCALGMGYANLNEQLINAQKGDVLIIFEFPTYSRLIYEAAAYAEEKGMFVVLITDSTICPTSKFSKCIFLCESQTELLKNSMIGPLFFINFLMAQVICRFNEKTMRALNERERILKLSDLYMHVL